MSNKYDTTESLTPREMDILDLLAQGYSDREIAEQLVLSLGTIKWYNRQMYNKLAVNNRHDAVDIAKQNGILNLDTQIACANNLPAEITPFVGREQEQSEVTTLISEPDIRLVTVMGFGGMGKTRLAIEVGRHFLHKSSDLLFADGVYFVYLASVNDSKGLVRAIADALDFRLHNNTGSHKDQLLSYLNNKNCLLILDNFDHLLDNALIVIQILQKAPNVRILVTSRERLNISGETIFRLKGMGYPSKQNSHDSFHYGAVQLFLQSVKRVRQDFTLNDEDLPHIIRICHLVQGMPLGIILAASWIEILSLDEIGIEITRNIDFLSRKQRDLPKRLTSIRAVFDYSWNIMQEIEREVFMKLCVFRGGFTREAVETISGADLYTLISLTNKSLIQHDIDKGRYSVHELLRQYASQQLHKSGQWASVQQKHVEFYAALAERAEPELRLADQEQWFHVLETEYDNLCVAMSWALESGNVEVGLRMVVTLRDFWFYEGYHVEGQNWCDRALRHIQEEHTTLHGRILLTLGLMTWARNEVVDCQRIWEQALTIFQSVGDRRYAAWTLGFLGGSKPGYDSTNYETDIERVETAIGILQEIKDQPGLAQMLNILGNIHRIPTDYQKAKVAYKECLELVRQTGEKRRQCIILENLSLLSCVESDFESALTYARECLRLAYEIGFKQAMFLCLHPLAGALVAREHSLEAAKLVGIIDAYLETQNVCFPPNDKYFHDSINASIHQHLDTYEFEMSWKEGNQMVFDDAIEFALHL